MRVVSRTVPKGHTCQENVYRGADFKYVECGKPAVGIVETGTNNFFEDCGGSHVDPMNVYLCRDCFDGAEDWIREYGPTGGDF